MTSTTASRGDALRAGLCLLCLLACAFAWAAVWNFDLADWPSTKVAPHNEVVHNACGRVGAWLAYQLFLYIGPGTYALLICVSGILLVWVTRGRVTAPWQRSLGVVLLVAVTAGATYLLNSAPPRRPPIESGGIVGVGLGRFLQANFHVAGTALILLYAFVMGLLFAGDGLVTRVPALLRRAGSTSGTTLAGAGTSVLRGVVESIRARRRKKADERTDDAESPAHQPDRREPRINPGRPKPGDTEEPQPGGEADEPAEAVGGRLESSDTQETEAADSEPEEPQSDQPDAGDAEGAEDQADDAPTVNVATPDAEPEIPAMTRPYPVELAEWELPPIRLLDEPEYQYSLEQEAKIRAQAKLLEETLEEYRVDAHVVEIDTGPVITLFELQVGPGVKVSQITSLANDIARALKAPSVRVVAPIPGKNTIGIEVPNIDKERVCIRELVALTGHKARELNLPLFLGKDASGNPLVGDLTKMPHLLIAGTTGSGKSVCINSIITSLLLTQRPDMCKLILVDPKMVELSGFRDIPHLMCPIVTEISRAEAILDWAVTKMEERYELLAEAGVRNVAAFNRLSKEDIYERFNPVTPEEKACVPTHIPQVIIIIDELADLMMTSGKEVEHCLARLAQKSRAVGIHIIVATQRPEARIVTGLIKSNMSCRIAFRVSSRMDSRIVLDQNGAEVLMGQGDMLFLPPGQSKLVRAQGTMVADHELRKVLEFVKRRGQPDYHPELVRLQRTETTSPAERDELFDEAVKLILESKRGSVSLLQRRLTIGYSRASRLIDQMADAGIVGDYKGSQAREVLMTLEEWDAIRASRDREEAAEADQIALVNEAGDYVGEEDLDAADEEMSDDEITENEEEDTSDEPPLYGKRHITLTPPEDRGNSGQTAGNEDGQNTANEDEWAAGEEDTGRDEDVKLQDKNHDRREDVSVDVEDEEGDEDDWEEEEDDECEDEEDRVSPADAFVFDDEIDKR